MYRLLSCVLGGALALTSYTAFAHHSFATLYDLNRMGEVTGEVTEVVFTNPHVEMYLRAADGQVWNVQAQSVAALQGLGWTRDRVQPGDQVAVRGYSSRVGSPRLYLVSMMLDDGSRFSVIREGSSSAEQAEPLSSTGWSARSPSEQLIARLPGRWYFDVDKPLPGAPLELDIWQERDGQWLAALDGEQMPVELSGDQMRLVLHRENAGGFGVQLELVGTLNGDQLQGRVAMIDGSTNQANLDATAFFATRDLPQAADRSSDPFELSGVWRRVIGVGPIGRTNPQLTEAGLAAWEDYGQGLYDPALRCLSVNPMRKYADPGLVEFLETPGRLTILYASKHDVRRVSLGQEQFNPAYPPSLMGESIARWQGGTLVIDTRNFLPSVLTHNAEPISADAHMQERYWMEGEMLIMEAKLTDPQYYQRPVMRRTAWVRDDEAIMVNTQCDPDSYYRGMWFDGVLEDYFDRAAD